MKLNENENFHPKIDLDRDIEDFIKTISQRKTYSDRDIENLEKTISQQVERNLKKRKVSESLNPTRLQEESLKKFRNTHFFDKDLRGITFRNCTLHEYNFSESRLQGASFVGTKLRDVNFSRIKTGLTSNCVITLRILCFPLIFLAGIAFNYSFVALVGLVLREGASERGASLAFLLFLGIAIAIAWRTMRFPFMGFIVAVAAISLIIVATPEHIVSVNLAKQVIFSLALWLGTLSGFVIQLQILYLNNQLDSRQEKELHEKELEDFSNPGIDNKKNILLSRQYGSLVNIRRATLYACLILGLFLGSILASTQEIVELIFLTVIFFPIFINLFFSKRTLADRASRYEIIYLMFELISQNFGTRFLAQELFKGWRDTVFHNVNLEGADLRYATLYVQEEGTTNFGKALIPEDSVNSLVRTLTLEDKESGMKSTTTIVQNINVYGGIRGPVNFGKKLEMGDSNSSNYGGDDEKY